MVDQGDVPYDPPNTMNALRKRFRRKTRFADSYKVGKELGRVRYKACARPLASPTSCSLTTTLYCAFFDVFSIAGTEEDHLLPCIPLHVWGRVAALPWPHMVVPSGTVLGSAEWRDQEGARANLLIALSFFWLNASLLGLI